MIYEDPDFAPSFLRHSFKFKNAKDVFSAQPITNPKGWMKDTASTIKKSPLQGIPLLTTPGMGKGASPAAIDQFVRSKGQDKYDPNRPLNSSLIPTYEGAPVVELPAAAVPDAPYSLSSRAVTDKMRAARAQASNRKGYMATLFAKETGGFGATGAGSSLLGG